MNLRFRCPHCECPGRANLPGALDSLREPSFASWQCPQCDHVLRLHALPSCAVCGNAELYRKKDFPHGLGMGILVTACLASTITYWLYDKMLTWAILLGSAAFDGLLYLWVKDAIVCYRCNAHHLGGTLDEAHKPFELTIHERYRQERLRELEIARLKIED